MLLKPLVNSCRAASKAFAPLAARAITGIRRRTAAAGEMPIRATVFPTDAASSGTPNGITAEHARILAMLEETARLGHVPADALLGRLYACHCYRLEQDRQQLAVLEQEQEVHLARLNARFPAPPPPEPEKPQPPRGRRFGPISRDLRRTGPRGGKQQ